MKWQKLWCEVTIFSGIILGNITPSQANWDVFNGKLAQNLPAPPVNPQPNPNRDRFLQPTLPPLPSPEQKQPPIKPLPTPPNQPERGQDTIIKVEKVQVIGSTIFNSNTINPIIQGLINRNVRINELKQAADSITQLYLDRGYITSRAVLVEPSITDGIVQIRVIEGSIEKIEVQGTKKLNPSYIRDRLLLGAGTPLNTAALENQLRLLRSEPLFKNIEASLRAGNEVGKSILTVRVTEAKTWQTTISFDNYSPPSVGSERFGIQLVNYNVTGLGDQIFASYNRTFNGGADILDINYRVPINAMNGTIQVRYSPNWNHITQAPFQELGISGESQLYEVSYRQPIVRSIKEELALSLGFNYQNGQTFTFQGPTPFGLGPDAKGISRTSTIKFGQDYIRRDVAGAWAVRSQFNFGVDFLNPTINPAPIPDGRFFSWIGQIQRVQRLNENNLLIISGDVQLTPNTLLPSQQFVIGGGQSLRGYRQNIRSGDNGFRFSIENRMTVNRNESGAPTMQIAPFIDVGTVWNIDRNPNTLPPQKFLVGTGLGLLWEPVPRLNVRLDYGFPLINLRDKGINAQDEGFYFNINYFP